MLYIPRQRSPWEQYLPQMLMQMAMMKIGQNFEAKQTEIAAQRAQAVREQEFGAKVGLAGGKEVRPVQKTFRGPWPGGKREVTGTPEVQSGYRRFKAYGKTFDVPLSKEEILSKAGIVPLGYGQVAQRTESGKWVVKKTATPIKSELGVIAKSLGIDLSQPITQKQAQSLVDKVTSVKKDRAKATLLELLMNMSSGNISIASPSSETPSNFYSQEISPEELAEYEQLKAKAGIP